MQTEEQRNITEAEEMEKIDLVSWLQDYLSCLKKFWLQFLNLLMNRFILQRLHMRHQEPNI